jgi:DNA-binding HxlR family transcriptional regulator
LRNAWFIRSNSLGRLYKGQECSAARSLEIVGERWSLLILRDALFRGYTRFSDFQRSLGIAPNILARRLETFVDADIMEARPAALNSEHSYYVLTAKGIDLKPAIIALTEWGDRWLSEPGPAVFTHQRCEGHVRQELRCEKCGKKLKVTDVVARKKDLATKKEIKKKKNHPNRK